MYAIHSTYSEYSPEFDGRPDGRRWPGEYADRGAAWAAVRRYLLTTQNWHPAPFRNSDHPRFRGGLAPFGHDEPTAFPDSAEVLNDAETIVITEI